VNRVRRFLIVDDHVVVRQGLKFMLAESYPGAGFGEASDGIEMFKVLRQSDWDIVILDISLPGRSGLELLRDIKQEYPRLPVLILSAHGEDEYAVRVLKAGAAGYLAKAAAPDELIRAVRKILGGGKYVGPGLAETLATRLDSDHDKPPHELLSDREFQVLCLIASGKSGPEIAASLALNVKTISTFRTRILAKLGLRNTAELTRYAVDHGLTE